MIGSDLNCDILQLSERLAMAALITEILNLHPEWYSGSRRLNFTAPTNTSTPTDRISDKVDHINAKSWRGDLTVQNVNLKSCWQPVDL